MSKIKGPKKYWPAWRYHESAPEGQIFASAEDVPGPDWVDHPSKIGKPETEAAAPAPAPTKGRKAAEPKPAPKKGEVTAEEERQTLLAAARDKFGPGVPAEATREEIVSALGGEAAALEILKAANGHGR